jgi:hypothetical protein
VAEKKSLSFLAAERAKLVQTAEIGSARLNSTSLRELAYEFAITGHR